MAGTLENSYDQLRVIAASCNDGDLPYLNIVGKDLSETDDW